MKKSLFANTALAVLLGLACLAAVVARVVVPAIVLPRLDVPLLTLFSVAALAVEAYAVPKAQRAWGPSILLAGLTFAILPWCAGLVANAGAVGKLFLLGALVYAVAAWLYGSMAKRMASGPAAKAAPALSAFVLFLAAQSLSGLTL